MIKLSKREIVLVVVLFIAISIAMYYNFVFKPYVAKSDEVALKISDTQSSLSDLKLKKASTNMINGKIEVIKTDLGVKLNRVLDSIDNPAIIVMLRKTLPPSATSTVLGFSPTYKDLKNNYVTIVEVSFKCNQEGFVKVLTNLSTTDYVNRVINSTLTVVDPVTNLCDARISIEILTKSITPTKMEFTYS